MIGAARVWRVPVIKARTENEDGSKDVTKLTPTLVHTIEIIDIGVHSPSVVGACLTGK